MFHNVEQNTDEWYQLRAGLITSSALSSVMAKPNGHIVVKLGEFEFGIANTRTKSVLRPRFPNKAQAEGRLAQLQAKDVKKSFGDIAKKYAVGIAVAQITGKVPEGGYINDHMERGHEEEPIARMAYEAEYFCDVTNGGFFESGDEGCSPDGLVGDDGVIEIKSAIQSIHYARVARQSFDPAYKWQLAGNLRLTGRDWIDFISYCSEFPEGKRLYVHRSYKADFAEEFKMIDARLIEFRVLIEKSKETILTNSYSITGDSQ